MSQYRRLNLLKTLSKSDIDEVLDQYGSEQPLFHPLMCGNGINEIHIADTNGDHASALQEEWDNLFGRKNYIQRLKYGCINGNLGTDNFRSVCWRVFWESLSEEKNKWLEDVKEKRGHYDVIRSKYVMDPYEKENVDLDIHHPLSQEEDSIWHQYFQDNELRHTIMQDLDRLFPEIEFFQQECIKSVILHILFCYARENPQVQYKQGMHEVLAPLVYIMVLNSLVVKKSSETLGEDIKIIMDVKFIEHDAYILFFNIMESIEPWYANLQPLKGNQTTAISKKLTRIQCYMLKRYDTALRDHLEKIEVTPQLYGIRWIRLLFGREFPLNRLLVLWDAIFANGIDLVDYIYLAMLINLRGILIQSDFSDCLGHLMKYPVNTDTKYILKRAVALKKHKTEGEVIPSSVANQMENNICNTSVDGKPVFYSQRHADMPEEHEAFLATDCAGMKSSMRPQRSNSLGKQFSSIKNKVESKLSDSLKAKHPNKQYTDADTINTLIEDHAHLQKQVSELQTQLDKMSTISLYCGGKMDLYISVLQDCLLKEETCGELEVHSFAGLKQVRDILKDGLENCATVPDYDEDFRDIDEHIADASNKVVEGNTNETLTLIKSPNAAAKTPEPPQNVAFENECDSKNVLSEGSPSNNVDPCSKVDVMYFDHKETIYDKDSLQSYDESSQNNDASPIYNDRRKVLAVDSKVVSSKTAPANGATSSTIDYYHGHMYDEVQNSIEEDFHSLDSGDELDNCIRNEDVSFHSSPLENALMMPGGSEHAKFRDLDPLTSFQIDLASCADLSDNFNY